MNKQQKINQVCEYILDQDHERDHIVEEIVYCLDDKMSKRDTKAFIQGNTTWYIANELYYGKRQAKSNLEAAYQEAVQIRKGRTIKRSFK